MALALNAESLALALRVKSLLTSLDDDDDDDVGKRQVYGQWLRIRVDLSVVCQLLHCLGETNQVHNDNVKSCQPKLHIAFARSKTKSSLSAQPVRGQVQLL